MSISDHVRRRMLSDPDTRDRIIKVLYHDGGPVQVGAAADWVDDRVEFAWENMQADGSNWRIDPKYTLARIVGDLYTAVHECLDNQEADIEYEKKQNEA